MKIALRIIAVTAITIIFGAVYLVMTGLSSVADEADIQRMSDDAKNEVFVKYLCSTAFWSSCVGLSAGDCEQEILTRYYKSCPAVDESLGEGAAAGRLACAGQYYLVTHLADQENRSESCAKPSPVDRAKVRLLMLERVKESRGKSS